MSGPAGIDEIGKDKQAKYYVDGGSVQIATHVVYELDSKGKQLRVVKFTDYASETIRNMYPSAADLQSQWSDAKERTTILDALAERGITLEHLAENAGQLDADPFDLLCHVAFSAPLRTRRERAEQLRKNRHDFWEHYKPEACQILNEILEKYIKHGAAQFKIPDILKIAPISDHGNVMEIATKFDGADKLRAAVEQLQTLLYTA